MTTGSSSFDEKIREILLPTLRELVYVQVSVMFQLFVKDRALLYLGYEPREKAYVRFGVHDEPIDIRFSDFSSGWWEKNLYPYEEWLSRVGRDQSALVHAYGEWEEGGLRLPQFEIVCKEIQKSLPIVEEYASRAQRSAKG